MKAFGIIAFCCFVFLLPAKALNNQNTPGVYESPNEQLYKRSTFQSFYLPMPDSVLLAVDLYLPKNLKEGEKIPLILHYTRYTRSIQLKWPFRWIINPFVQPGLKDEIDFFIRNGYAFMNVDTRGSGASFGYRKMEFSKEEVKDGYYVIDWIAQQHWSNGKVGTMGVSYPGTTAELLLTNNHPALKAAFCRNSIFDLYEDIVFPGGLRHSPFVEVWGDFTRKLDFNDFSPFGRRANRFVKSINPVDDDRRAVLLNMALEEHKDNTDIFSELLNMQYRDDNPSFDTSIVIDAYSVMNYLPQIERSGAAIYRLSGYFDGALANSAVKGYLSLSNPGKMILGPWRHGSQKNKSPHRSSLEMEFDVKQEMLRFFDYHLKGIENGIMDEPQIYYYTMREEKWKWAESWPPENTFYTSWQFTADSTNRHIHMDSNEPSILDKATYEIDYTAASGLGSRWNSLTELYMYEPTGYPDRQIESNKLLYFDSNPLEENKIVTGHVLLDLHVSVDEEDANLIIYLEEVEPDGTIHYVTEGQLRLSLRKTRDENYFAYTKPGFYRTYYKADKRLLVPYKPVRIEMDLIPVSYQFAKGNKIRISIAGADADHFDDIEPRAGNLFLHLCNQFPSKVLLPVEK
ncbi:MAG: CocE/NonD family hydrolase [Chitinophagaceae bacterium]|nr:MAG: CocE/NonD family hydrolase [Chitinophagaceae bacterium]